MFQVDWIYIRRNVSHGFFVLAAALIGYLYLPEDSFFSVLMPVTGYAVALFYITKGRTLPGITAGLFFGFFGLTIFREIPINVAIPIALIYALVILGEAAAVHFIVRPIDNKNIPTPERLTLYGLLSLAIVGAGTGLMILSHWVFPRAMLPCDWNCWLIGTGGQFLSLLVFAYTVTRSHDHGHVYRWRDFKAMWFAFLFIGVLVNAMVFDLIPFLNFNDHKYFLFIFFIFAPFKLRRSVITHYVNIIVVAYGIRFYLSGANDSGNLYDVILELNLFLIAMISASLIMYHLNDNIQTRTKEVRDSAKRIEDMFFSTTDILNISSDILDRSYRLDQFFMKRAFKIAQQLFGKYDAASCYYFEDDKIVFIDAVNYDVDFLNTLTFYKPELGNKRIIIRNNIEQIIQNELQTQYNEYNRRYKPIRRSISLYTTMENNTFYGMTFDILEGSDEHYTVDDAKKMEAFQHFLDNAYEIHRTQYQKDKFLTDIVDALIQTLELYDVYTGTHSQDVAFLTQKLCEKVGLSRSRTATVYWASVLHDIGKIGVPDHIINKPAKLTKEEYEAVKQHAINGFDILDNTESLHDIAVLVRHHHEHWDGGGYPDGLQETEIPYGSAIIGIADAVSSMLTKRPYSPIRTIDEVKEELLRCKGTQFHPQLVDATIELLDDTSIQDYFRDNNE